MRAHPGTWRRSLNPALPFRVRGRWPQEQRVAVPTERLCAELHLPRAVGRPVLALALHHRGHPPLLSVKKDRRFRLDPLENFLRVVCIATGDIYIVLDIWVMY